MWQWGGASLLAPVIVPVLASVSKPLEKSAIKSGIILFEKRREAAAELTDVFEDLVAKAQAEFAAASRASAAAANEPTPAPVAPVCGAVKQ